MKHLSLALAVLAGSVVGTLTACATRDTERTDSMTSSGAMDTTMGAAPHDDHGPMAMGQPDAQMKAVLDQLQALRPKPLETLTADQARKQPTPADAAKRVAQQEGKSTAPDPSVATVNRSIPGPAGALRVRVYTPKGAATPLPVVVYYHGGGWVIANKEVYDGGARALSKMANAIVLSVDYRQGPEHRFPAAHEDAFATYQWAIENAASIKGDRNKVAVAGESAGGGLAVATAMMARDRGIPLPVAVIAVYPIAGIDTTTASYVENASAKPLSRPAMSWFFANYLNGPQDRRDPRVDLVNADLRGLPPTTIINAQIDPLRSEGETLARKLRDAGVTVDQKTYDGVAHEFFGMGLVIDKAKDAESMAASALTRAFGS